MNDLGELLDLLWSRPNRVRITRASRGEYALVPSSRDPRLIVPMRSRAVTAAALARSSEQRRRRAKLQAAALSVLVRCGLGGVILRDRLVITGPRPTLLEKVVTATLGPGLELALRFGPPRANRKPVALVFSPDGVLRGVAKIGVNELTRSLVQYEAETLADLARNPPPGLILPTCLATERFGDLTVMVQSPLDLTAASRSPGFSDVERAVRAVSGRWRGEQRLIESDVLAHLWRSVDDPRLAPRAGSLRSRLEVLEATYGDITVPVGAWHGDLAPGNLAVTPRGIAVWDWERYGGPVPVGFDLLHWDLQHRLSAGRIPATLSASETLDRADTLLAGVGVAPEIARVVAELYLLVLVCRYLHDGHPGARLRSGDAWDWIGPALLADGVRDNVRS